MRSLILLSAAAICSWPSTAQSGRTADDRFQPNAPVRPGNQQAVKSVRFPLQLEMRVPFEPTAFPSEARMHLFYELTLTNFATSTLHVSRIEVFDADARPAQPIAVFRA